MQQKWKFPAAVRATVPGKGERRCLVVLEDTFDVDVVAGTDAPVLYVTKGEVEEQTRPLRGHNGRIFRYFDYDFHDAPSETGDLLDYNDNQDFLAYGHNPVYKAIAAAVKAELAAKDMLQWPKDANRLHANGGRPQDLDTTNVIPTADGQDDIARYTDMFRRYLATLVVIDGVIWQETREPVWIVDRRNGLVRAGNAELYDRIASGDRDGELWETPGWATSFKVFPADARAEAIAYGDAITNDGMVQWLPDQIEVLHPELLSNKFASLELDRIARAAYTSATDLMGVMARRNGADFLRSIPPGLFANWTTLRMTLEGYSPFDGVPDELEGAFSAFMASVDGLAEIGGTDWLSGFDRDFVAEIVSEWVNRPISYEETMSPSPQPR
jgi:hypothetical protein